MPARLIALKTDLVKRLAATRVTIVTDRSPPASRDGTLPLPVGYLMLVVALISCILIVARRPDAISNAQFYGEDGTVWYAQAYNLGRWRALLVPQAGYFVTDARLAALIATFFPLSLAPLVLNILAIGIQVLPAVLLFSRRFASLIPSLRARALLAFLYLALPNSSEINANMANAQWHLALLAFMVVVAPPPSEWGWRGFDVVTLVVAGLSGPYCIALFPIIALRWWQTRKSWTLWLLVLDGLTTLIQGVTLVQMLPTSRVRTPLGVNALTLIRIVGGQIFLGATIGMHASARVHSSPAWSALWLPALVALAGSAIMLYAMWRGPVALRLLLLYSALLFAAALAAPDVSTTMPQWQVMTTPGANDRYYILPMIAFFCAVVWLLGQQRRKWLRNAAFAIVALTILVGIPLDWEYPAFPDLHFSTYAAQFGKLHPGASFTIPTVPSGWTMTLVKHR